MKTLVLNYSDLASGKSMNALKKAFAKTGTFVVTAETDNKEKKSAGVAFKTINLSFNDGQKISLDAKSTGDVFSVRLNGSVLPIKNHEDLGKAVSEIITAMDKSRKKFQARQTKVKVELPKGIKSTAKRKIEVLRDRITELDGQIKEATARRDSLKVEMGLDSANWNEGKSGPVESGREAMYHGSEVRVKRVKNGIVSYVELDSDGNEIGKSKDVKISLFLASATPFAMDSVDTGKVRIGDTVHHPKENRTGMVRKITRAGMEVRTTRGLETWDFDDAFDYAGQPRDTDGTYAEGKKGSVKAGLNKAKFALKKAFRNPFRAFDSVGSDSADLDNPAYTTEVKLPKQDKRTAIKVENCFDSPLAAMMMKSSQDASKKRMRGDDDDDERTYSINPRGEGVEGHKFERLTKIESGKNKGKYKNSKGKIVKTISIRRGVRRTHGIKEQPRDEDGRFAKFINPFKKAVKSALGLDSAQWSADVETKWHPEEGFFTRPADEIANGLKAASDDLQTAMGRLNFYINRAGSNLSGEDKARLESAKDKLGQLYDCTSFQPNRAEVASMSFSNPFRSSGALDSAVGGEVKIKGGKMFSIGKNSIFMVFIPAPNNAFFVYDEINGQQMKPEVFGVNDKAEAEKRFGEKVEFLKKMHDK